MAMEKAAENQGEAGAGMGMGLGMMMPAMFAHGLGGTGVQEQPASATTSCTECQNAIPADARFCPLCGHQQLVLSQCVHCGKNMALNAKFCSRCGHPATERPQVALCSYCKAENLPGAMFCNQCGQRID
jgi:RNA polymerase subunit RPABC4/transcription elongation factor Spt4